MVKLDKIICNVHVTAHQNFTNKRNDTARLSCPSARYGSVARVVVTKQRDDVISCDYRIILSNFRRISLSAGTSGLNVPSVSLCIKNAKFS